MKGTLLDNRPKYVSELLWSRLEKEMRSKDPLNGGPPLTSIDKHGITGLGMDAQRESLSFT
jgi:hypothetical protein